MTLSLRMAAMSFNFRRHVLPFITTSLMRRPTGTSLSAFKTGLSRFSTSSRRMSADPRGLYTLPTSTEVCALDCTAAFNALSDREKLYAHYLSRASWYGSLICLYQTSPESPGIFLFLQALFNKQSIDELKQVATKLEISDEEFQSLIVYAAGFYGNMGNYKSFGDTKFVPGISQEKLGRFVEEIASAREDGKDLRTLWERVGPPMFSLEDREKQLGLGQKGISTYFSSNCDIKDAEAAQKFMDEKDLSAYNTRLFKTEENGQVKYEVRLASANKTTEGGKGDVGDLSEENFAVNNTKVSFKVTRGDYAPLMQRIVDNLLQAKNYAANDYEREMLEQYSISFRDGSIEAHRSGSRSWIKNKGPIIESYIGFIESYRDPFGVRGEFEGFVAMVNKEMSGRFEQLVDRAEHLLPLLPWPAAYEKDTFLRPDFTSLEVLTFASSGIPAGINIPNYDDIRQSEGFKNVSLGNVISAGYKDSTITFLGDEDMELYSKLKVASFEVQVGIHELLGHGSGKMFVKHSDGTFNFDTKNVKDFETGKPIATWYEAKETWDSKFKVISSSFEECRAECVGIYLCLSAEVVGIFGHHGDTADDLIYVNWLNMARSGLLALEFYTPETATWRQAHMQARYVILQVLLEAGDGLVRVERTIGEDGQPDIRLHLTRGLVGSVGKKAIGDFLKKLQLYKSTANYEAGKALYDRYSHVGDHDEPRMLSLRDIVLQRKQPRKMFVQCETKIEGEKVSLVEYESSPWGLVQSFVKRFPLTPEFVTDLQTLWDADRMHFK